MRINSQDKAGQKLWKIQMDKNVTQQLRSKTVIHEPLNEWTSALNDVLKCKWHIFGAKVFLKQLK